MKKVAVLAALTAVLVLGGCAPQPAVTHPYPLDADRIREDTEYMCNVIGPRVAGTEKETEACNWLQTQLEEMGFSGLYCRIEKDIIDKNVGKGVLSYELSY